MKYKILIIAMIIAGLSSCKELENVDGSYEVVMVGSEDYSSYDITMNIDMGEENRISGKSACNNYSGTFENPKGNQVVMGMFMGTKMFCKDTNAVERDYMDHLSQVTTVKTTSDGLKMMNANDEVIITAIKTEAKK